MLHDLERRIKRILVVPLAAPFLLLTGFSLGEVTTHYLELPDHTPVRSGTHVPRMHLDLLGRFMSRLHNDGAETADYVKLYHDHVKPVEHSLRIRGVPNETARRVAWPLVEQAQTRALDPATVLAVLLIESRGQPRATSPVGARGLMQVMPMHSGRWVGCGRNLYDIEDNLCYGTSILSWYLRRYGDERRALLGYNGCVRGTFTKDCFLYPDKVATQRRQILAEWQRLELDGRAPGMAASP
ncbi:MAG: lytic transglycosylase domain-containing protein [Longimicrobiales bacterium]